MNDKEKADFLKNWSEILEEENEESSNVPSDVKAALVLLLIAFLGIAGWLIYSLMGG